MNLSLGFATRSIVRVSWSTFRATPRLIRAILSTFRATHEWSFLDPEHRPGGIEKQFRDPERAFRCTEIAVFTHFSRFSLANGLFGPVNGKTDILKASSIQRPSGTVSTLRASFDLLCSFAKQPRNRNLKTLRDGLNFVVHQVSLLFFDS